MAKRINLTLNDDLYESIKRLAKLQEKPMATVINEFLTEMHPTLDTISDALEIAQNDRDKAFCKMQSLAIKDTAKVLNAAAELEPES